MGFAQIFDDNLDEPRWPHVCPCAHPLRVFYGLDNVQIVQALMRLSDIPLPFSGRIYFIMLKSSNGRRMADAHAIEVSQGRNPLRLVSRFAPASPPLAVHLCLTGV
jgi:hypothetical protein